MGVCFTRLVLLFAFGNAALWASARDDSNACVHARSGVCTCSECMHFDVDDRLGRIVEDLVFAAMQASRKWNGHAQYRSAFQHGYVLGAIVAGHMSSCKLAPELTHILRAWVGKDAYEFAQDIVARMRYASTCEGFDVRVFTQYAYNSCYNAFVDGVARVVSDSRDVTAAAVDEYMMIIASVLNNGLAAIIDNADTFNIRVQE